MPSLLKLETGNLKAFVSKKHLSAIIPKVDRAHDSLEKEKSRSSAPLGWLDLPAAYSKKDISRIKSAAARFRKNSELIITVGIGGSYLGAKASVEALASAADKKRVIFAGNNLSGLSLERLLSEIRTKDVSVNVVSKSGTTTEPAVAFRIIESAMRRKYRGRELRNRIICTTDKERGALRKMAVSEGYETFVIPADVGGRFSVLTPVGLLPMALAGIDIEGILAGARVMRNASGKSGISSNIAHRYAAIRNILYGKGKVIEILSGFDPDLHYAAEWWKQLFGESEGKGGKGIFPAACDFTQDLHSMGQMVQDGKRNIFETFLVTGDDGSKCSIPYRRGDLDELNYIAGRKVSFVNHKAYMATRAAHFEGGVPNMSIVMPARTAYYMGQLFYFFQKAAAISGKILGVNPFDQPGVDSYKKKMFVLLGKK